MISAAVARIEYFFSGFVFSFLKDFITFADVFRIKGKTSAEVAQLVEHQPSKLIVASSILVFRSNADEKKAFQMFLKGFFRPPSPKKEKKGGAKERGNLLLLDKMSPQAGLVLRAVEAMRPSHFDALQQPSHVFTQGSHRLQPLQVFSHIVGREAMHGIPILRSHDRHVRNGEILVELFKGSRGSSPATGYDRGSQFPGHAMLGGKEQSVEKRDQLPGRPAVINRRTDHHRIEFVETSLYLPDDIVPETMPRLQTLPASNTPRQRLFAQIHPLGLDAMLAQDGFHFVQSRVGTPVFVRATVYQQGFHAFVNFKASSSA